jgi:hypothetical protein
MEVTGQRLNTDLVETSTGKKLAKLEFGVFCVVHIGVIITS